EFSMSVPQRKLHVRRRKGGVVGGAACQKGDVAARLPVASLEHEDASGGRDLSRTGVAVERDAGACAKARSDYQKKENRSEFHGDAAPCQPATPPRRRRQRRDEQMARPARRRCSGHSTLSSTMEYLMRGARRSCSASRAALSP